MVSTPPPTGGVAGWFFYRKRHSAHLHEVNKEKKRIQTSLEEREKDLDVMALKNAELQNQLYLLNEKFSSSDPDVNPLARYEIDISVIVWERDELRDDLGNKKMAVSETTLDYLQNINRIISCSISKSSGKKLKGRFISGALKKYLDSFDADTGDMKNWEYKLDIWTGGAVTDIRKSLPRIKDNYVLLAVYILYGFDVNAISRFFHKDAKYIYNLKTSLVNKLQQLPKEKQYLYHKVCVRLNSKV